MLRKTMVSASRKVRPSLVLLALWLAVICGCVTPSVLGASESDAVSAIAAAEERIIACYSAAAKADDAGADVTTLVVTLNEAGMLLPRAELSFEQGDFDTAVSLADEIQSNLADFTAEAETLAEEATWEDFWSLFVTVGASAIGVAVVILISFVAWIFVKKRVGSESGVRTDLQQYRLALRVAAGMLVLIAVSPALNRLLILPQTESFTELWVLDRNREAEDYPFDVAPAVNHSLIVGIENHLGTFAYYLVEVKFRNETQPAPSSYNHTSSSLPALLSKTAFVADKGDWELPLTFSFDYLYNMTLQLVEFRSLTLNNDIVNIGNYTAAWSPDLQGAFGNLFFELWIYNATADDFQYHERFVSLWFNMTG